MASLSSVLDDPRGNRKPSAFDSLFSDSESRSAPIDVQATSSALAQPNESVIAPLLTAEATSLGLKYFRCVVWVGHTARARPTTMRDTRPWRADAATITRPRPAPRPAS